MKAASEYLTFTLYSALWRFVRLLPERKAYSLFNWLSRRAYKKNGRRVQRLRANYWTAFPKKSENEIEEFVKSGLANAMRYWCDTFRISDWSTTRVATTVTTENNDLFVDSVKSGAGVIIALPHAGNWDHAGLYYCSQGITVHTVAEHLKPERLFKKFLAHREGMGMKVLDLQANVTEELIKRLNEGELIALVADRDLSKSGVEVDFFGARARLPAGPALLAYRTKAHLIAAYVSYTESGIRIAFNGPFVVRRDEPEASEVQRLTQEIANRFEFDIQQDPTSWHMQQRIFVEEESN
ncbi:MAG: phosphatidylinositol mannoside acyltransferase [Candidatus Nanopelagicaceae bacterium]